MYKNLLISTKKKGHQNVVQVVKYNQHIEKIFDHTEPQLLQILNFDNQFKMYNRIELLIACKDQINSQIQWNNL